LVKLLIFDHDMTLVDSNRAIAHAVNLVAKELEKPAVSREIVLRYAALPLRDLLVALWGECRPEWLELYKEKSDPLEYEMLRPFPGVPATLSRLHEMGIFLAVASNRKDPRMAMDKSRTSRYFDAIIGLDGGFSPKPDPAMLHSLMGRFGAAAAETMYVGDSDVDIQTGLAAGVYPVGATTGYFTRGELLRLGAWRVVDAIEELVPIVLESGNRTEGGE
jgi:HAD superfamily hydrolase (TIGR01509 family)